MCCSHLLEEFLYKRSNSFAQCNQLNTKYSCSYGVEAKTTSANRGENDPPPSAWCHIHDQPKPLFLISLLVSVDKKQVRWLTYAMGHSRPFVDAMASVLNPGGDYALTILFVMTVIYRRLIARYQHCSNTFPPQIPTLFEYVNHHGLWWPTMKGLQAAGDKIVTGSMTMTTKGKQKKYKGKRGKNGKPLWMLTVVYEL